MGNPIGFSKAPVTLIVSLTYIALFTALLCVHHITPKAPSQDDPVPGINITEAWQDLQVLSNGFHPYNSHRNDDIRNWLLTRIEAILDENKATFEVDAPVGGSSDHSKPHKQSQVVIYNDLLSNTTFYSPSTLGPPLTVYFEGTNIIVWVRGEEDNEENVLVNAHYDSVSTGYGATDDGVGVVSILQLIKHFTTKDQRPRRGLVALFNNGEEDYLNGARAFLEHPISKTVRTFVNLEGAGAGGRAAMFRSTDAEVTEAYKKVPYPFGTSVSSDAFKAGAIRSQTDYVVFNGDLGARGLDIAFMAPRARYHTSQDSTKYTSKDSLWHMLSAALATTRALTSNKASYKLNEGSPSTWFDVLGKGFGLMKLEELFALSVSMLVLPPLVLLGTLILLTRLNKCYIFALSRTTDPLDPHTPDEPTLVKLGGWRGFTRLPIALVFSTGITAALALAVRHTNPYIIYSSPYAVWSFFLATWLSSAWFFLRGSSYVRPSALHRAHALGWIFVLLWAALVAATVLENEEQLGGVYPIPIFYAASFLALEISYLEMLSLPKIDTHVASEARRLAHVSEEVDDDEDTPRPSTRPTSHASDSEPTETTSLLSHRSRTSTQQTRVIGRSNRPVGGRHTRSLASPSSDAPTLIPTPSKPSQEQIEQSWSASLPSWLWVIQLLVLAPVPIILVGQIALFLTSASSQTPADGNPVLPLYLEMVTLSVALLLPTTPFLHRANARIPFFLFLVALGTGIYTLTSFPFSPEARLKVYFQQKVDIDTGLNEVSLHGLEGYVQSVVADLPSSHGQKVHCHASSNPSKKELTECKWSGIEAVVVPPAKGIVPGPGKYAHWLDFTSKPLKNISSLALSTSIPPSTPERRDTKNENETSSLNGARIRIKGRETRACKLIFDEEVHFFSVKGSGASWSANSTSNHGTKEIRLWSREWDRAWMVDVHWDSTLWAQNTPQNQQQSEGSKMEKRGLSGQAICLWSDASKPESIPALEEVKRFGAAWSIVSKLGDGLVEGSRRFVLE